MEYRDPIARLAKVALIANKMKGTTIPAKREVTVVPEKLVDLRIIQLFLTMFMRRFRFRLTVC